jgi:adenylosuccinate synthase
VIGNGAVIDPISLWEEMSELVAQGVKISSKNLLISECAHIVFPFHRLIDEQREASKGITKIGTTKRGIGPAYGDKVARVGIRLGELLQSDLLIVLIVLSAR